jgi:U4/U6.U5 tri-snRNP-associated protein 2
MLWNDSYEIIDSALNDVKLCLNPVYDKKTLSTLNDNNLLARDVYGISYLPGFVGLNNLKVSRGSIFPLADLFRKFCV